MTLDPTPRSLPRLALAGTGALGSELSRLLMDRCHDAVLLIDPEVLEPGNLPLSRLFRAAGAELLGRPKVKVVQHLAQLRGLCWQTCEVEVADVGVAALAATDLLVTCTDSALSRLEAAALARAAGIPMLDGAVQSGGLAVGRVSWFAPAGACYGCGLSERRRAELLHYASSATLGCMLPSGDPAVPMTGSEDAIRATAQTMLHMLENPPEDDSFALRLATGDRPGSERLELTPSPACPFHDSPAPATLRYLPHHRPLRQVLAPGEVLELPWPVCLRAQCVRCGSQYSPHRRTALVRRRLRCPECHGQGTLEPLDSVEAITRDGPAAPLSLHELGLSPEHRYHVRSTIVPKGEGAAPRPLAEPWRNPA